MARRVVVWILLANVGVITLAVGSSAQVAPRTAEVELPPSAQRLRQQDRDSYEFSRALFAVRDRVREARTSVGTDRMARLAAPAAVSGSYAIPVFLVRFANTVGVAYPPSELEEGLFSTNPDSATLRAYYLEQSGGLLSVGGQVYGWHPLPNPDTYYEGTSNGLTPGDARTGELIASSLSSYDAVIDFGIYDNDGPDGIPNSGDDDGYVDFVAFVHPEAGGECGGTGGNLWSHRWRYSVWPASGGLPFATNDASASGGPILIDDYVLQPGLDCGGSGRIEIGVFCHEFGHAFGLPDLYDTNGGGQQGVGDWGLMASGNWNSPASPAHMSAWTKQELGWVQTIPIEWAQTTLIVAPVNSSRQVYEVVVDADRWNPSSQCTIAGARSLAVGVEATESSARGWAAPLGYANGWVETVVHDFHSDGSSPLWFDYDYRMDSEGGFDFGFVLLEVSGAESTLAVYDGQMSGHGQHELSTYLGPGPTDFRIKFRFRSDEAYSNEDGNFVSACSPFVVDDIQLTGGGLAYAADFETHRGGWFCPPTEIDNPVSESWLFENRRAQGFDAMLHGQGLLLYHVDRDVMHSLYGNSGGSSGGNTRGLVVEEADGNFDLLAPTGGNRGDAGDPWPGAMKAALFDSTTVPAAITNAGLATNFRMRPLGTLGDAVRVQVEGGAWPPTLSGVSPDSVQAGPGPLRLDLVGATRVQPGATLRLISAGGGQSVSLASHWQDFDRVGFDFDGAQLNSGVYEVVVQNPDGQNAVVSDGLSVLPTATAVGSLPSLPDRVELAQNHPNPFNPRTTILFELPRDGPVRLAVYDLQGRRVRTLVDARLSAGAHRVVFDGVDARGRPLASGVYLYRLEQGDERQQKKLLLVR